jgi:membrane-associated HD superfamily phosphohydrolase
VVEEMSISCPSLIADYYPALCMPVDNYCERADASFGAEPLNALTNAAFLVAAWAAWRLYLRHPHPQQAVRHQFQALIVTIAIVGLGSFLFHTIATRWAEWGDVLPILLFMLLYLWLLLTLFSGVAIAAKATLVLLYFSATAYLEAAVPARLLWGGALYIPTVIVMAGAGAVLCFQQPASGRRLLVAIGVFFVSLGARTLDAPICPMFPLGTHFVWHLLNATVLYLLLRMLLLSGRLRGLGA